jgi:hypothetical protein
MIHTEIVLTSIVLRSLNADLYTLIDMLAATSVLQQQAADIRNQRINWQSYLQ